MTPHDRRLVLPTSAMPSANMENTEFPHQRYFKRYTRLNTSTIFPVTCASATASDVSIKTLETKGTEDSSISGTQPMSSNKCANGTITQMDNGLCAFNYIVCIWLIVAVISTAFCRFLMALTMNWKDELYIALVANSFHDSKEKQIWSRLQPILSVPFIIIGWAAFASLWLMSTIFTMLLRPVPHKLSQRINTATCENCM